MPDCNPKEPKHNDESNMIRLCRWSFGLHAPTHLAQQFCSLANDVQCSTLSPGNAASTSLRLSDQAPCPTSLRPPLPLLGVMKLPKRFDGRAALRSPSRNTTAQHNGNLCTDPTTKRLSQESLTIRVSRIALPWAQLHISCSACYWISARDAVITHRHA